ncbi:MAG: dihydrofolate reductase [Gorillibacterium sp.]|nr:dihydrofolate reductase [Gorillibacterium sp.]
MISFILAMGLDRSIGLDNKLPWRLPADLAYFKKITMGHPVLMGRKTYESMGKPLPGRLNIVATRDEHFAAEGVEIVHSPEDAISRFGDEELFVIGGAEIFQLFLPHADKLYVTLINERFKADTFFSEIDPHQWVLTTSMAGTTDAKNPYSYAFLTYERKTFNG